MYKLRNKLLNMFSIFLSTVFLLLSGSSYAATYMGSWDLDGSGTVQTVYNTTISTGHSVITVTNPNGLSASYDIYIAGINASWKLMGVQDVDGAPGLELIFSVKTSDTATQVQVISHRDKKLSQVSIGNNVSNSSWSLIDIIDTDGKPGKELVLNVVNYSGFFHHYEFVHFNGGITTSYFYADSASSVVLLGDKFSDTDGIPGMEVIVNVDGRRVSIYHDKSQTTSYIDLSAYSVWSVIGYSDLNGVAGNEIVIRTNAQSVLTYNDVQKTSRGFTVDYDWNFAGFVNQDGQPGNEVMFNTSSGVRYLTYGSQVPTPPTTQPPTTQPPNTQSNTTNICGFIVDNNKPLSTQYFRIYTPENHSLNVEQNIDKISIENSQSYWWSAMWYLEKAEGYYRIVNRWNNTTINLERQTTPFATFTPLEWWSAMWTFNTDLTTNKCSIKNRWRSLYLSYSAVNYNSDTATTISTPYNSWRFVPISTYYSRP